MMKNYYLVTTEHLEEALWFRDDGDFATGMNYVAIQAALMPEVIVLVFILMSNHVHFVLHGARAAVEAFVNNYKARYALYMRRQYGSKEFLRRNRLDVKLISEDEDDALERAMAYVQMNCVAASICLYPGQYSWGTGNAFFQPGWEDGRVGNKNHPACNENHRTNGYGCNPTVSCRRLESLSGRERIRLLHSGEALKLPEEWLLSDAGYVLPESYADVEQVEKVFRSPNRMQYFLNSSSKARKRLEAEDEKRPAFRDQVILGAIPDLLRSLFQKSVFGALSIQEQAEALRQIRFRFSAGVHQAARVCGISYAEAAKLLDTSC